MRVSTAGASARVVERTKRLQGSTSPSLTTYPIPARAMWTAGGERRYPLMLTPGARQREQPLCKPRDAGLDRDDEEASSLRRGEGPPTPRALSRHLPLSEDPMT